mmetsp:Transcript_20925/g.31538  ORF Transcript_20925/g.31538 Transcript_20925/m.31538 type:complete len:767 (-) Transcript_20925:66-2366(-)
MYLVNRNSEEKNEKKVNDSSDDAEKTHSLQPPSDSAHTEDRADPTVESLCMQLQELQKLFEHTTENQKQKIKELEERMDSSQMDLSSSNRTSGMISESAMGSTGLDESEASTRQMSRKYSKLQASYSDTCQLNLDDFSKQTSLVFLHPEDVRAGRDYSDEELERVALRRYPSRIFITNVQIEWNTVWLRTRHTDHHSHRTTFVQVRDAIKADFITNNPLGAKYSLTELFNMCYGMEKSNYYSFACTLASAFSEGARNTEFSRCMLEHHEQKQELERMHEETKAENPQMTTKELQVKVLKEQQLKLKKRLLQLMDIVFSKLKQKQLLVDEHKNNIYRVVRCMTYYNETSFPYFYAFFSFVFQVTASIYVILNVSPLVEGFLDNDGELVWDWNTAFRNLPLALVTFCYGIMVALPELRSTRKIFVNFYGKLRLLAFMDAVVNLVLPVVLPFFGFVVVLQGETFIDSVFNSVALVFITEIDDQLPRLLELDVLDIVQGFLVDRAIDEYESENGERKIPSIQFSDMHITNTEESGSRPSKGVTFQPYEVFGIDGEKIIEPSGSATVSRSRRRRQKAHKHLLRVQQLLKDGDDGQQVANKRSVTTDCLLKKISWQYTEGFDNSSRPRIGHLKLEKLVGANRNIEICGKQKAKDEKSKTWYSVKGVYIITSFSMSDDILRLRICGSHGENAPVNFVRGFEYYNLWPLHPDVREILSNPRLKKELCPGNQREEVDLNRVLYGSKDKHSLRNYGSIRMGFETRNEGESDVECSV